jgi:hypothetical protein
VIIVWLHEADAPWALALELGVPVPVMVMPMPDTLMPEVQVHDPAGMTTTSPSTAVCVGPWMTAFTSLWLQEVAV